MTRETAKKYFAHEKCKLIDKSDGNNVNGKTVVAIVPIKKRELVCYVCGTIYSENGPYRPDDGYICDSLVDDVFSFYDENNDRSIDPGKVHKPKTNRVTKHISGFINHSCEPNCEIIFDEDEKMLKIVAIEPIGVDEEITIYYSDTWFERRGIYCQCGKAKCKFSKERELTKKEKDYAKEGERIERIENNPKRNRTLRDKVIKNSKGRCQVCGRQLTEMYGEFGAGVLEVHHETPLGARKGKGSITHLEDLIAVCPNCHAVLHNMEKYPTDATTKSLKRTIKQRREENEEE